MFLLKTAWENIFFHKKRSFLSVALVAVATATILLSRGLVEYFERGMAIGFIQASGHIEIAKKGFWDAKTVENSFLDKDEIIFLNEYVGGLSHLKSQDAVLNFQGMIGTDEVSTIFWGQAYDEPFSLGATKGEPVFADDTSIVLGEELFEKLNLKLEDEPQVSLMTSFLQSEISTGSFEVCGNINTGSTQNDAGFLVASRSALLEYFEVEDMASYIRVYLDGDKYVEGVQKVMEEYFENNNLPYEVRDWKSLNPSWAQVSGLFNVMFFAVSTILCILVFVSLTQSISASFMERIGEFGTMEAIGLGKSALIISLVLEVLIIAFFAVFLGVAFAHFGNFFTDFFNITMNPPGSNMSYGLHFFITPHSVFSTQVYIVFTCLCAICYPIYTIARLQAHHLMHYSSS